MQVINAVDKLRNTLYNARCSDVAIGFVPTMGNLHDGHISLVEAARKSCDIVVVSIFVNPLQFGVGEDLDTYPRTMESDKAQLLESGCDILFAPQVIEMYPNGKGIETVVDLPALSQLHCGITRPHFFKGVATVVVKLLGMVQPNMAFFGEKDWQQLTIIRRVVSNLSIPVSIIGVATKREPSGLALSSRNGYLSDQERQQAAALYLLLEQIRQQIVAGGKGCLFLEKQALLEKWACLEKEANGKLVEQGFEPDYFHICQRDTLLPADSGDNELVILAAAKLNGTRLIDNIAFDLKDAG